MQISYKVIGENRLRTIDVSPSIQPSDLSQWVDITAESWWDQTGIRAASFVDGAWGESGKTEVWNAPSGSYNIDPSLSEYEAITQWWKGLRFSKIRVTFTANGAVNFALNNQRGDQILYVMTNNDQNGNPLDTGAISGQAYDCVWPSENIHPDNPNFNYHILEDLAFFDIWAAGDYTTELVVHRIEILTDQHLIQPPAWTV